MSEYRFSDVAAQIKLGLRYFSCPVTHTCHKLWTKICEIRQNFKGDLTKFCEIFLNITLEFPQYSLKSLFSFKKLVKTTTVCDLCLFLHKNVL